jgi:hypothetical protein
MAIEPASTPRPACPTSVEVEGRIVSVEEARAGTPELVSAFALLMPQLSMSVPPPRRRVLEDIVDSPDAQLLVAKDPARVVVGTLTLVRTPTGTRVREDQLLSRVGASPDRERSLTTRSHRWLSGDCRVISCARALEASTCHSGAQRVSTSRYPGMSVSSGIYSVA